jgi:hypothetical protein
MYLKAGLFRREFFILNNLWFIISNITKPTKGLEVPELKEKDMPVIY